jgi:hypothetical protein
MMHDKRGAMQTQLGKCFADSEKMSCRVEQTFCTSIIFIYSTPKPAIRITGFFRVIMSKTHSIDAAKRRAPLSSFGPELPVSRYNLTDRLESETTPLLRTSHAPVLLWDHCERWLATKSAISAFFAKNTGLLLAVASQFFFSGMNISVKALNNSDDPVPTLEVRVCSRMVVL